MPVKHISAGHTDIGLVRTGNEDFLYLDEKNGVYAVCDGMGGHQAGEVASKTASETIGLAFNKFRDELLADEALNPGDQLPESGKLLLRAIRLANRNIHNQALENPHLSGMGTTVVAVAIEDDVMSVIHVGDSRAYRLEKDGLTPLTEDHSWIVEAQKNTGISSSEQSSLIGKNVITRALGVKETVEADYRVVRISPGESYILCSDGLCGFAEDDEIFETARKHIGNPGQIAQKLIDLANSKGGNDNVTVIAVEIAEMQDKGNPEADLETCPEESEEILAAEDRWLTRINDARTELARIQKPAVSAASSAEKSGPGKGLMLAIFGAFIVVAALMIYLTTSGK